jgi:hypothetical protein
VNSSQAVSGVPSRAMLAKRDLAVMLLSAFAAGLLYPPHSQLNESCCISAPGCP